MGIKFRLPHPSPYRHRTPARVLSFLDPSPAIDWQMEPEVALEHFRRKGLKTTYSWMDMLKGEHDAAFTVAKMMDQDLLADMRDAVDRAIANGDSMATFSKEIIPTLEKKGWWGRKEMTDPLTGDIVEAQLGSPHRLETIFRTNIQSAYSVGDWEEIKAQEVAAPYLLYDAVDDGRVRAAHAAHDGTVLPISSPFWRKWFPPNGWGCRCNAIQLSEEDLEELGLAVSPEPVIETRPWTNPRTGEVLFVPEGMDPGWDHHPGQARIDKLKGIELDKTSVLAEDMKAAAQTAKEAAEEAAAAKAAKIQQEAQEKAEAEIDQHLADKTPYLAPALKAMKKQKQWADTDPQTMLEEAKKKAEAAKLKSQVADYKIAKIKGKEPTAQAQAAFDSLSPDAQAMLDEQIEDQLLNAAAQAEIDQIMSGPDTALKTALKAEIAKPGDKSLADKLEDAKDAEQGAAMTALGDIAEGKADDPGSFKKNALNQLSKIDGFDNGKPSDQLSAVLAKAQQLKDTHATQTKLSGYKKKVLDGKIPTPAQQAAFNSLTDDEKEAFLFKLDKAKEKKGETPEKAAEKKGQDVTEPSVKETGGPPVFGDLIKIEKKQGSNEGGVYQNPETGEKWYVKTPGDDDIARNEVLAGKLYQLAGIDSPEIHLIDVNGKAGIASRIIEGLEKDPNSLIKGEVAGVGEGFPVDAWLANWDVVGYEYDNLLVKNGKAYRIDPGGALVYRAQGGKKGGAFGNTVTELDTLLQPSVNPQSAHVFDKATDAQISAGVQRVLNISDADIETLVKKHGPGSSAEKSALAKKLIARKKDLASKFPHLTKSAEAAKKAAVAAAKSDLASDIETLDNLITAAIKGISAQEKEGGTIRSKDILRVEEAMDLFRDVKKKHGAHLKDSGLSDLDTFYGAWIDDLKVATAQEGSPAKWTGGWFTPTTAKLEIDPSRVAYTVPKPGEKPRLSEAEMRKRYQDAFGDMAANITPRNATAFSALTLEERRGIYLYTASYYRDLNESLYENRREPKYLAVAEAINQALDKASPYKGITSRGMSLKGEKLAKFIDGHKRALSESKKIRYRAFTSSTKGTSAAFDGNIKIEIRSRTGVHVNPISANSGRENEVLYKAGTVFRVEGLESLGHNKYQIVLVELEETSEETIDLREWEREHERS